MNIFEIARVAHEVNRAYCHAIGDDPQPAWSEAPDWQKNSLVEGVGFALANPDATPSASHESWLRVKEADGWKHGPVKDPDKKQHPCFLPYDRLSQEQRVKDHLFLATVRALVLQNAGAAPAPSDVLHKGLPVPGYKDQPTLKIELVTRCKYAEEEALRLLDDLAAHHPLDPRWYAIGRTDIEKGFMAVNRSIFKPARVKLAGEA